MKKILNFINKIKTKVMGDNYFDFLGSMMFGRSDEELDKLFKQMSEQISQMKEDKDYTPEKLEEHLNKMINSHNKSTTPPEIANLQRQVEEWAKENLTPEELDERITNIVGEPVDMDVIIQDDMPFEQLSWRVGAGYLTRLRELTPEEYADYLDDMESLDDNYKKVFEGKDTLPPLYDLNKVDEVRELTDSELEEEMEYFVEKEDYAKAIEIRDKIKERKDKDQERINEVLKVTKEK